jgi:hypothetical protein
MVVEFITICALCDKVCQGLATGRWFSLGTLASSINKTDRHDITEILLKVALSTINQTKSSELMENEHCDRVMNVTNDEDYTDVLSLNAISS